MSVGLGPTKLNISLSHPFAPGRIKMFGSKCARVFFVVFEKVKSGRRVTTFVFSNNEALDLSNRLSFC